jgi:hypothetical protein
VLVLGDLDVPVPAGNRRELRVPPRIGGLRGVSVILFVGPGMPGRNVKLVVSQLLDRGERVSLE